MVEFLLRGLIPESPHFFVSGEGKEAREAGKRGRGEREERKGRGEERKGSKEGAKGRREEGLTFKRSGV